MRVFLIVFFQILVGVLHNVSWISFSYHITFCEHMQDNLRFVHSTRGAGVGGQKQNYKLYIIKLNGDREI